MSDAAPQPRKRVWVDPEICQSHTQCSFTAPELFALRDEDGRSQARLDVLPVALEDLAALAVDSCPEHAIVIENL